MGQGPGKAPSEEATNICPFANTDLQRASVAQSEKDKGFLPAAECPSLGLLKSTPW